MPDRTVLKTIDRWIDSHKRDLVDLTYRLVSINTTVPPGLNYPKISQLLASEIREMGVAPSVSNIPESAIRRKVSPEVGLKGPRPNTYATIKGEHEGPKILLNGHVDVVPADPSGWSHDPFKPVVKNGKIYGRGSADMKGSDACQIYSLKALSETGAVFSGSITPTFTTDEEVGGYSGVNYLIDKHVITKDVDYCISTDSGIEALHIASLGDAEYFITVKGRAAHSGRGWTGVNAIEYGASLIEELKKLGVQISKRRSRIDAEPVYGTRKMRPGLYVNLAKGGLKGNIIPDTFEILVDRRFIPEENASEVQKEVERVVRDFAAKHREVKVSMKPILGYDPMLTPPDHSLVKTVRRVARKILGKDVPPCGSQGSTDVSAVTALGVPVAILGTTRESSNIHGIDENVRIDDLVSVTKILAHTYLELL
ncbi:MAG TPA: ArgE/DapE family deacylase [Candidatus Dormibacteraeota bacterium]|nr:ArgE/DapE family deacylase [Candidatus Dormibacteraeota bacterium]